MIQLNVTEVEVSDAPLAGAVRFALPVGQVRTVKLKVEALRVESYELHDG